MKRMRIIAIVLLLLLALGALAACNGGAQTPVETTAFAAINALIKNVSYPFTLSVTVTEGEDAFNGTYRIAAEGDAVKVDYSIEKLAVFDTSGGKIVAPESYKTTVTGSLKIKDGAVIEQSGEAPTAPAEAFDVSGITLNENALTEVKIGDGKLTAKATSLRSLTGINADAENVRVEVTYTAEKISTLKISYSSAFHGTEMIYSFD